MPGALCISYLILTSSEEERDYFYLTGYEATAQRGRWTGWKGESKSRSNINPGIGREYKRVVVLFSVWSVGFAAWARTRGRYGNCWRELFESQAGTSVTQLLNFMVEEFGEREQ